MLNTSQLDGKNNEFKKQIRLCTFAWVRLLVAENLAANTAGAFFEDWLACNGADDALDSSAIDIIEELSFIIHYSGLEKDISHLTPFSRQTANTTFLARRSFGLLLCFFCFSAFLLFTFQIANSELLFIARHRHRHDQRS
jgi:hypothetical protein